MTNSLKSCPFCGSEDVSFCRDTIHCNSCKSWTRFDIDGDFEKTVLLWNTRPLEDELLKDADTLKTILLKVNPNYSEWIEKNFNQKRDKCQNQ